MSKNLKIEIRPVFRLHMALPENVAFGYLCKMIQNHRGDVARQPMRHMPDVPSKWSLQIDFEQPADRSDFMQAIQRDLPFASVVSLSQIHVPTTCRS